MSKLICNKTTLWYYVEDNVQTHMQKNQPNKKQLVKFTQEKAGRLSSSQFQIHIFLFLFHPFYIMQQHYWEQWTGV